MSLADTVRQKLAEWQPGRGRQDLVVAHPETGWAVTITADRRDELSCMVWEVTLQRQKPQAEGVGDWAARVASRVTGLLEALTVHEVDALRNEALLRSEKPSQRTEKLAYYEVHLKGTMQAAVRRFQVVAEHGLGRREQTTFTLTHDGLAKLAGDIAG